MPDFIFVYFTDGGESTGCGLEGCDALACGSNRDGITQRTQQMRVLWTRKRAKGKQLHSLVLQIQKARSGGALMD